MQVSGVFANTYMMQNGMNFIMLWLPVFNRVFSCIRYTLAVSVTPKLTDQCVFVISNSAVDKKGV